MYQSLLLLAFSTVFAFPPLTPILETAAQSAHVAITAPPALPKLFNQVQNLRPSVSSPDFSALKSIVDKVITGEPAAKSAIRPSTSSPDFSAFKSIVEDPLKHAKVDFKGPITSSGPITTTSKDADFVREVEKFIADPDIDEDLLRGISQRMERVNNRRRKKIHGFLGEGTAKQQQEGKMSTHSRP